MNYVFLCFHTLSLFHDKMEIPLPSLDLAQFFFFFKSSIFAILMNYLLNMESIKTNLLNMDSIQPHLKSSNCVFYLFYAMNYFFSPKNK